MEVGDALGQLLEKFYLNYINHDFCFLIERPKPKPKLRKTESGMIRITITYGPDAKILSWY